MLKDTFSNDLQGFFDNKSNFILKEIGIIFEKDPSWKNSFLIEPPYDFTLLTAKSRKTAIWLSNTHHNIFWNDGESSFSQTRKYLRTITSGKKIICKGVQKKRFLQTFFGFRQLINIEEMSCPSINRFKGNRFPFCETHLKGGACSLNNAYIILTFFNSSSKTIK